MKSNPLPVVLAVCVAGTLMIIASDSARAASDVRCAGDVWALPVPDDRYRITATFGSFSEGSDYYEAMRDVGALRMEATTVVHTGVDLGVKIGTPIYAVSGGVVAFSGYSDRYGRHLVIAHGELEMLYGHLDAVHVEAGQTVKCGQVLGLSGATGKAIQGAHLHFEARQDSVPFDPLPSLKRARQALPIGAQPAVSDEAKPALAPAMASAAMAGGLAATIAITQARSAPSQALQNPFAQDDGTTPGRAWQQDVAQWLADVLDQPVALRPEATLVTITAKPFPQFGLTSLDGRVFVVTADPADMPASPIVGRLVRIVPVNAWAIWRIVRRESTLPYVAVPRRTAWHVLVVDPSQAVTPPAEAIGLGFAQ